MIDLHSHTTASDGTLTPAELIEEASRAGVRTLAITDHDTLAGYDEAVPVARAAGLELICGIEVSTKLHGSSTHLLGYFPRGASAGFRAWLEELQASRRDRNARLVGRLRELGIDITLDEVRALGRSMTGRPHFARVLVDKGYVATIQEAFDRYLDESAEAYVDRLEPSFAEAVARIRGGGGIASLAHPVRLKVDLDALLPEMQAAGLGALEAYHSDHSPEFTERVKNLAASYGMVVTGGSDFHGDVKPDIGLGTGRGNLRVPDGLMERLRSANGG